MDIRDFFKIGSSRLNADIVVDKIEEDPDVFDTVWDIMLEDSYPISMRAAWVIYIFGQRHPYFLEPRAKDIIKIIPTIKTESVLRCLLGVLRLLKLPVEYTGQLFDFCYNIVESQKSAIAPKVYAMTILYNISELEPELKSELITLFEEQSDTQSGGIKSITRNLLKKLYRELLT